MRGFDVTLPFRGQNLPNTEFTCILRTSLEGLQRFPSRKDRSLNVGGEIDCTCPRCKCILTHVILYFGEDGRIGAVECRTCGLQHPYRSYRFGGIRRPLRSPKTLIPLIEGGTFQERLSRLDPEEILPYRLDGRFRADDAIQHPRFGVGFVLRVREERIEVLFADGIKVLVQGS